MNFKCFRGFFINKQATRSAPEFALIHQVRREKVKERNFNGKSFHGTAKRSNIRVNKDRDTPSKRLNKKFCESIRKQTDVALAYDTKSFKAYVADGSPVSPTQEEKKKKEKERKIPIN